MKLNCKTLCVLVLLLGYFSVDGARTTQAAVILEDDFEYGVTAANLSACQTLAGFNAKWNGDSQEQGGSTIQLSSTQKHSGSYSLLFDVTAAQDNVFLEANHSYGSDIYVQEWIYPVYPSAGTAADGKLLYVYVSGTGSSVWCLKYDSAKRRTGSCDASYDSQSSGWSLDYLGAGCATSWTGLIQNKAKYIRMNRWNKLIVHVRYVAQNNTLVEFWLDNGDGSGLEQMASVNVTDSECAWPSSNPTAGRIKLIGLPQQTALRYYVDDVKIVTAASDIDWGDSSASLDIETVNLPSATVSAPYSSEIAVSGGTQPFVYSVTSGSLPTGLSLNGTTGHIEGTPTCVAGSYDFTVNVRDSQDLTDSQPLSITVSQQITSEILIQADFESGSLEEWVGPYGEVGSSNSEYGFITSSEKYSGGYSFQETIPPSAHEGGKLRFSFADNPQRVVYSRFYYKCAAPWDPLTANKFIILNAGNVPGGPTTADLQIILDIVHAAGSHLGEFQVEQSNYLNGQTVYVNYRQNVGTPVVRETDRWYLLETLVDAGTPGQSDGRIKLWIDGQLKCDYENVNLLPRTDYSQPPLFHWLIVTNYADPAATTRTSWYDDFVLATGLTSQVASPARLRVGSSSPQ